MRCPIGVIDWFRSSGGTDAEAGQPPGVGGGTQNYAHLTAAMPVGPGAEPGLDFGVQVLDNQVTRHATPRYRPGKPRPRAQFATQRID
jgi:hypothetical protein